MSATSSATAGGSPTIRTSQAACAELYRWPGVAATCNLEHIKRHYYESHRAINPTGIVPKGPALDLEAPSGRDRF